MSSNCGAGVGEVGHFVLLSQGGKAVDRSAHCHWIGSDTLGDLSRAAGRVVTTGTHDKLLTVGVEHKRQFVNNPADGVCHRDVVD